jgi:hypothetical protein
MKESNIDEKLQDKDYLRKFIRSINYYLND